MHVEYGPVVELDRWTSLAWPNPDVQVYTSSSLHTHTCKVLYICTIHDVCVCVCVCVCVYSSRKYSANIWLL